MAIKPVQILITAKDKASGVFDLLKKNALSLGATVAAYFGARSFLGAIQGATVIPLYLMGRSALRIVAKPGDAQLLAGALALLGQFGALTMTEFGTTYYDTVMACFALTAASA